MANRYCNPCSVDGGSDEGHFEEGAPRKPDRFTRGANDRSPTHNPAQPHLGLNLGPHTHAGATMASNAVTGRMSAPANKPGTQATLMAPSASDTAKSMANRTNVKAQIRNDIDHVEVVNPPKGMRNGS